MFTDLGSVKDVNTGLAIDMEHLFSKETFEDSCNIDWTEGLNQVDLVDLSNPSHCSTSSRIGLVDEQLCQNQRLISIGPLDVFTGILNCQIEKILGIQSPLSYNH
ncbi:hypothetical protein LIER_21579 [Lithospermum erythrorhizon]|uniref:Uncharacterized protein n=1 Tax=Lithospermum erythrorhizon TaxID=34254 RepID=A0AAV3QQW1_LITER